MANLRGVLLLALVGALVAMWLNRAPVIEAYTETGDEAGVDIRLTGVDLDHELADVGPSPYVIDKAPDTRHQPLVAPGGGGEAAGPDADDEPSDGTATDGGGEDGDEVVVDVRGGTGLIRGIVRGPDGPVAGATVRIERHTVAGAGSVDLTAGDDGRWSYSHVLGGRYRVRAWHPGGYASAGSEVFFLAEHETTTLELAVETYDEEPVLTFTQAGDIYVGLTGTVAVTVTRGAVDEAGVLAMVGLPGAIVSLEPTSGAEVVPGEVTADSDGVARFQVRCLREGSVTGIARHQDDEVFFVLPDCVPQPANAAPTSAPTAPGSTTPGTGSTSGTTTTTSGATRG